MKNYHSWDTQGLQGVRLLKLSESLSGRFESKFKETQLKLINEFHRTSCRYCENGMIKVDWDLDFNRLNLKQTCDNITPYEQLGGIEKIKKDLLNSGEFSIV